ncbi:unnamed protein product [Phytophthora fragariaefolia]|uniref:Unnamed protein product n=1 Tax=Phytophthora fragariaefolia TaxID=1490495 RepID=A0A9W7D5H4_9STRA|nr:unnamed protein product [Phytophthora fragariaefolia]
MRERSYIPEAQMLLHPTFKNLDKGLTKVVRMCCSQLRIFCSRSTCRQNEQYQSHEGSSLMELLAPPPMMTGFSEALGDLLGPSVVSGEHTRGHEARVEDELERWLSESIFLQQKAGVPENILAFWHRMEQENRYHFLPRVARALFAIPTSSASIERDFGVAGMIVTN